MRWDLRFMEIALDVSRWSKDPSTKVGAVVVQGRRIRATGYNGFPRGIADDGRLEDRLTKYAIVVHAEMNAVLDAGRDCEGATLYLHGMPGPPCSSCAKHMIQAGIRRVVTRAGETPERWREDLERSRALLAEAGVELVELP